MDCPICKDKFQNSDQCMVHLEMHSSVELADELVNKMLEILTLEERIEWLE